MTCSFVMQSIWLYPRPNGALLFAIPGGPFAIKDPRKPLETLHSSLVYLIHGVLHLGCGVTVSHLACLRHTALNKSQGA